MALGFLEQALLPYVLLPLGILGLLSLLVILLVYLIKPKSKTYKLPSVIFLMRQQTKRKRYRWMRYLPANWMLYLHLLLALLLTLAIMDPFLMLPESQTKSNVLHVIDLSASMESRFPQARELMLDNIGSTNTVIAVTENPSVIVQDAPGIQTRRIIGGLRPQQTSTQLVSALHLASTVVKPDTVVHIYSDMQDTTELAPELSRAIARLESNNNAVKIHLVNDQSRNVGIIASDITEGNVSFTIKNFNAYGVDVTVSDGNRGSSLSLQSGEVTTVRVPMPAEPTRFSLQVDDDFTADNALYVTPLPALTTPLLYISNAPNSYLLTALDLFSFIVHDTYEPPGVSNADSYDAFVLENVDLNKVLPGTITRAFEKAEQGGIVIIKMSSQMEGFSHPALPITDRQAKREATIRLDENEFTQGLTALSKEVVYPATAKPGSTVIATTQEGDPVIVAGHHGKGLVVYYGIDDSAVISAFKLSYAYPILLKRILQDALDYPSLDDINRKTGDLLTTGGAITGPDGRSYTIPHALTMTGFYTQGNRKIAVSLLDPLESQIDATPNIEQSQGDAGIGTVQEELVPRGLHTYIIYVVLALLLFEMLVLKWRGEL